MNGTSVTTDDVYDDESSEAEEGFTIGEYDISTSPNDFNILTLFSFMQSGVLVIPPFQRNYVWDIKRASKLIESIILGLPIPQIFLYEESRRPRDRFLVIDGQQRLMSIYYFLKERFPKSDKRTALRKVVHEQGIIPDDLLDDDEYFVDFKLQLPGSEPGNENRLNKSSYSSLPDRTAFDMKTVRNIIIKNQADGDSSIYEIFNRLNSGGINLCPQEIRASMYHSDFFSMLFRLNDNPDWRKKILASVEPELHLRDVEILLRSYAMLVSGDKYKPSMVKFLNNFSKDCRAISKEEIQYLERLFLAFIQGCASLDNKAFHSSNTGKFGTLFFEAAFAASCYGAFRDKTLAVVPLTAEKLKLLTEDEAFKAASEKNTSSTENVKNRISRAREIIHG